MSTQWAALATVPVPVLGGSVPRSASRPFNIVLDVDSRPESTESFSFPDLSVCMCVFSAFDYGFLLRISEDSRRSEALNEYLRSRSYLDGYEPSQADTDAFVLFRASPPSPWHVHAQRWYRHISALQLRSIGRASDASE